jgi:hypothetical protein
MSAVTVRGSSLLDRFRNLPARDRRALLLGMIVLGPAVLWMGIVRPWWTTLQELRESVVSEQELLDRERALLLESPELPARLAESRATLARKEALLVQSRNLALAEAAVTEIVEARARESRALLLETRSVARDPFEEAPDGLVPIRLNIRVESDFEGILDFLHALEDEGLLLRVFAFSIQRGEEGAMNLSVTVEAYAPEEEISSDNGDVRPVVGEGGGAAASTLGEDRT